MRAGVPTIITQVRGIDRGVALTRREVDVIRLLANGCTYLQIALHLGVSPHTVVTHIKNAYRKLDVHNGASAVMRAVQLGFFHPGIVQ